MSLLTRASARHLRQHPWQLGLAVLGIVFGVALAAAIDVATVSVRRAFAVAAEAVSGRATHEIVRAGRGVPQALYRKLRLEPIDGVAVAPFVGGAVALAGEKREVVQVAGIDPFVEAPFRPALAWQGGPDRGALLALLTRPGAVAVTAETARRLGLKQGAPLVVRVGAVRRTLTVVAVLAPAGEGERRALDGIVLADVATAQEALDMLGALTRIDVRTDAAGAARLARALPSDVHLQPVAARAGALMAMTKAFDLNLRALSLLALLVGAFLIYNTQTFSVVQRRALLGTLRLLGATRGELMRILLWEGAVMGVLGTGLGLLLGVVLGRGLVTLVSRAVSDLYFVVNVREVALPVAVLVRGAALGIVAALLSSVPAALEAGRTQPRAALLRSTLEQGVRSRLPTLSLLGVAFGAGACALLSFSGRNLPLAFVGLLLVVLAFALLAPAATVLLLRPLGLALRWVFGLAGRMAARDVVASLSRTGVAIAALMVALSVTVGVSVMVHSFRTAVEEWLGDTLKADVYVTAAPLVAARNEARLPRALAERLRALPGVAAVGTARGVTLPDAGGPLFVLAIEPARLEHPGTRLIAGDPARAWPAFFQQDALFASESFAYKRNVRVGEPVTLPTDRGAAPFVVAAIFRDYGSDAGTLLLSRRTYDRHFDDPYLSSVALMAAPDTSVDALVDRVRAAALPGEELLVRSNRALRRATLDVFDRTFEVTSVLRLLSLIVAAFGVMSALMALELERTRELGVLRALGFTAGQVAGLVALETALLGLVAGLLAIPTGAALAAVLVFVINRRSFGWTMDLALGPQMLLLAPLLGLVAGLAGGLYPAFLMTRASPAEALRDE